MSEYVALEKRIIQLENKLHEAAVYPYGNAKLIEILTEDIKHARNKLETYLNNICLKCSGQGYIKIPRILWFPKALKCSGCLGFGHTTHTEVKAGIFEK